MIKMSPESVDYLVRLHQVLVKAAVNYVAVDAFNRECVQLPFSVEPQDHAPLVQASEAVGLKTARAILQAALVGMSINQESAIPLNFQNEKAILVAFTDWSVQAFNLASILAVSNEQ